ncbi:helix-turn-helix domain-containing protein [Corynebacterium sp. 045007]|uniref:helix-turn-helix domain-containing protein n=1 Tax=Corynebacterium sp. 045007 TaxID=3156078 RepID=UPI00345BD614
MTFQHWLSTATEDSIAEISRRTGIPRRTLQYQLANDKPSIENLLKISSTYDVNPIETLLDFGIVSRVWEKVPNITGALRLASDEQLTDEVLRRLKAGSQAFDEPVDELAEHRPNTQVASCRRLAVTLGEPPRVWDFCGDGRWVMIRSLYAEPGHAPFPDRAGGPMPSTMIEERFGALDEMPTSVVEHIERECVGRRVDAAEILSMFHDNAESPTVDTGIVDLRTIRDGKAHDDAFDDDALIERINAGKEQIAAQEATEPLDEEWT